VVILKDHCWTVYCLAELEDGRLISASLDNLINIYDPKMKYKIVNSLVGKDFYCLVQLMDKRVVTGGDKILTVWK
jgi:hypothetical protein